MPIGISPSGDLEIAAREGNLPPRVTNAYRHFPEWGRRDYRARLLTPFPASPMPIGISPSGDCCAPPALSTAMSHQCLSAFPRVGTRGVVFTSRLERAVTNAYRHFPEWGP